MFGVDWINRDWVIVLSVFLLWLQGAIKSNQIRSLQLDIQWLGGLLADVSKKADGANAQSQIARDRIDWIRGEMEKIRRKNRHH